MEIPDNHHDDPVEGKTVNPVLIPTPANVCKDGEYEEGTYVVDDPEKPVARQFIQALLLDVLSHADDAVIVPLFGNTPFIFTGRAGISGVPCLVETAEKIGNLDLLFLFVFLHFLLGCHAIS